MRNAMYIIEILLSLTVVFTECKRRESDLNLETIVKNYGYPFETYEATTEDGYILSIYRIPGGRNETNNATKKKPVALFMHGLISSSACWLITGPHKSMAFMLADKGYDVWLGNNRGSPFSTKHIKKLETSYEFWNFSWHEMGIYDLPTTIDFALNKTGEKSLLYIGFSQGCTQLFVMGSKRPEYNKKIHFAINFAPAVFMGHVKGLITMASPITYLAMYLGESWGYFPIGGANPILRILTSYFCKKGAIWQNICLIIIFLNAGFGYDEIDRENLAHYLAFEPASSSWKQIVHYGLNYKNSGRFLLFDYGSKSNLKLYNSTTPPEYPLKNANFPVAIYHGQNDYLAPPKDVEILAKKLPNLVNRHLVKEKKLNHYDFAFGTHVRELVYNRAFRFYEKYRKTHK